MEEALKLYKTCGNRIVSDWELKKHVCHILGVDVDDLVKMGVVEAAKPTVEDCVRFGSSGLAVILYEELHNCDIETAYDAVQNLKNTLKEQI